VFGDLSGPGVQRNHEIADKAASGRVGKMPRRIASPSTITGHAARPWLPIGAATYRRLLKLCRGPAPLSSFPWFSHDNSA
jgi:hypothetical protein